MSDMEDGRSSVLSQVEGKKGRERKAKWKALYREWIWSEAIYIERRQYSPKTASATLDKFYQSPLAKIGIQDSISFRRI